MENNHQERHEYWRKLVEEQQSSGLSQKEFCNQRELVISQFVYYRCLMKNHKPEAPHFAPVKISKTEKTTASTEIKLSLPNGFQCSFSSHADTLQIKRLIEVLLSC